MDGNGKVLVKQLVPSTLYEQKLPQLQRKVKKMSHELRKSEKFNIPSLEMTIATY